MEPLHQYRDDPVAFVRDILGGSPWQRQGEILQALRDGPQVTVRSAHGVGKTWVAACAVLWYLYPRSPVTVLTSAPPAAPPGLRRNGVGSTPSTPSTALHPSPRPHKPASSRLWVPEPPPAHSPEARALRRMGSS